MLAPDSLWVPLVMCFQPLSEQQYFTAKVMLSLIPSRARPMVEL
jgi:hypothetical protein